MVEITAEQAIKKLEYDQAKVQQIEREIIRISKLIDEIEVTKNTIEGLSSEEKSALLPLGGGIYLPSKVGGADKILLNIGAGVVVEKETLEAILVLQKRKELLSENAKELQALLQKIGQESPPITGLPS